MKTTARTYLLLVAALVAVVLAGSAPAQTRPFASGGIGIQNGLGYLPGVFSVGGGVESSGRRHLVLIESAWASARKVETGDGNKISAGATAFLRHRFTATDLLIGGGAAWSEQRTSLWHKASLHPLIEGGVDHRLYRLLGRVTFPGNDHRNWSRSFGVGVEGKLLNDRLRGTYRFDVVNFAQTDQPNARLTRPTFAVGLKVMLGKVAAR